ncbi:hypothetical protein [Nonomuraea sp. NPDC049750]|uniref:hypothetical protein n=1 Tax=Nonomuraea sp. NPDC049750 TaxID=3154738 RepID=UPI0033EC5D0A
MEVESSICLSDLVPALRWSRPQQVAEALGDPRLPAGWWSSVALSRALGTTGLDWICDRLALLASARWDHLALSDVLPALTVHPIDPALPGWPEATRTAITGLGGWQRLRRLSPGDLKTPSATPEVVIGSVFREVLSRIPVQREPGQPATQPAQQGHLAQNRPGQPGHPGQGQPAAHPGQGHPEVTRPLQRGTVPGQRDGGPAQRDGGPGQSPAHTGPLPAVAQNNGGSPRQTGSFPVQGAPQSGSFPDQGGPQTGSFAALGGAARQTGSFPAQNEGTPAPTAGRQPLSAPQPQSDPQAARQDTNSPIANPPIANPPGANPPGTAQQGGLFPGTNAPGTGQQSGGFPNTGLPAANGPGTGSFPAVGSGTGLSGTGLPGANVPGNADPERTGPHTGPHPTAGPHTGPHPTATGPHSTVGPNTGSHPTSGPQAGTSPTGGQLPPSGGPHTDPRSGADRPGGTAQPGAQPGALPGADRLPGGTPHTGPRPATGPLAGTGTPAGNGSGSGTGSFPAVGSVGGTGSFPAVGSVTGTGSFPAVGPLAGTGTPAGNGSSTGAGPGSRPGGAFPGDLGTTSRTPNADPSGHTGDVSLPATNVPGLGGAYDTPAPAATPAPSETDHAMVRVVDSLFRSLDKLALAVAVHRLFAEDPVSLRTLAHKMLVDRDALSQAQRTAEERVLHWLRSSESAPVTGHMFRLTEWLGAAATQDQLIGADPAHPVMVPSLRTPLWRVLVTLMPDRRLQDGWLVVGDLHGLQARTRQLLAGQPADADVVELLSELGIRAHSAKAWFEALPETSDPVASAPSPAQPLPRRTPGANGHHHRGGQPIPSAETNSIDPSAALATLSALSGGRSGMLPPTLAGTPATPPPPLPSPSSDPRRWQRIEVTNEHLRGGPVPVPEGYATQLGMRPGTLLSVTGPGDNAIVLVWQGHQPVFDSLQPVLMRLNARPGDQVYVTVDGYRLEAQLTG